MALSFDRISHLLFGLKLPYVLEIFLRDGSLDDARVKRYWADQCGSFQIAPSGGNRTGGLSIHQRVTMRPGRNKWHENLQNPLTVLGDAHGPQAPTRVRVDVRVPAAAFPQPPLPPPGPPPRWHPAPLPPPAGAWVGLCGRVSSVGHNQNMGGVYHGVCVQLNATTGGEVGWRVEQDGTRILANGVLNSNQSHSSNIVARSLVAWHTVELAFECDGGDSGEFTAAVDGVVLASGSSNATARMAALASGWHVAEYDRFSMDVC